MNHIAARAQAVMNQIEGVLESTHYRNPNYAFTGPDAAMLSLLLEAMNVIRAYKSDGLIELVDLINVYESDKKPVKRVHIPNELANRMYLHEGIDVINSIKQQDYILGYPVVWDAPEFKVDLVDWMEE